jgi:hypothetical protein
MNNEFLFGKPEGKRLVGIVIVPVLKSVTRKRLVERVTD